METWKVLVYFLLVFGIHFQSLESHRLSKRYIPPGEPLYNQPSHDHSPTRSLGASGFPPLRGPNQIPEDFGNCKILPPYIPPVDDTKRMDLWELLDKTTNDLKMSDTYRNVVLLLGNTGSGKTTITQLIAGNASSLEVAKAQDGTILIVDPADKIGQTTASRTLIPELVVNEDASLAIYDCPGFSDNRGPNTDVAINFLLKKVTDHATSVKLMFVVFYDAVLGTNDKSNFDQLATSAVRLINDLNKLDPAIGLIVSKAHNYDGRDGSWIPDSKIIQTTRNFLTLYKSDQENKLNQLRPSESRPVIQKKIQFVSILLNENRIWFMRNPTRCGRLMDNQATIDNKAQLIDLLRNRVAFVPTTSSDFGYALTDSSYRQIKESVLEINDNIADLGVKLVNKLRKAQTEATLTIKEFLEVKEFIKVEYDAFTGLRSRIRGDPETYRNPSKFARGFVATLSARGYETNIAGGYRAKLTQFGEYLDFFETVGSTSLGVGGIEINRDTTSWLRPFNVWIAEISKKKDWYDFLLRVQTELSLYQFQNNKPVITDVPVDADLTYLKRIHPGFAIEDRIPGIYSSQGLLTDGDRHILVEILQEALLRPEFVVTDNDCIVRGVYVKTGDFIKDNGTYTTSCGPNPTRVQVFATKKLFMDRDISPERKSGSELAIVAPVWEIVTPGKAVVNLNGEIGDDPIPLKAYTVSGEGGGGYKGDPGNAGYPGGHFFGVAGKVVNKEKLVVLANGGRGGTGQNGGDGNEGRTGRAIGYDEWPSCTSIWNKLASYFDSVSYGGAVGFEYWVVKWGGPGYPGGYGGDGGIGGLGGLPGRVQFIDMDQDIVGFRNITTSLLEGGPGPSGLGGQGGPGGKRGPGTQGLETGLGGACGYQKNRPAIPPESLRAAQGSNGNTGGNSDKRVKPLPPTTALFNISVINNYKAFFLQKESIFLRNPSLFQLEQNPSILGLYNPTGFAQELLKLSEYDLSLSNSNTYFQNGRDSAAILLLPHYVSFLSRLDKYAASNPNGIMDVDNGSNRKVMSLLYATALSQANFHKQVLGAGVIVNLEGYLKTVLDKFDRYTTSQLHVIVEEERKVYADKFISKIQEALTFITETVDPAMADAEKEIDATTNQLQADVANMIDAAEHNEALAKVAVSKMGLIIGLRIMFGVLKVGAAALAILGPEGAAAGLLIGMGLSIGEKYAIPDDGSSKINNNALPAGVLKNLEKIEGEMKKSLEGRFKSLDKLVEVSQKLMKENEAEMGDLKKDLDEIKGLKEEFEKDKSKYSTYGYYGMRKKLEVSEKGLTKKLEAKQSALDKVSKDPAASTAKKATAEKAYKDINTIKNVLLAEVELGMDIYDKYMNDQAKLKQLNQLVEKAKKEVDVLNKYKTSISDKLQPMTASIAEDMANMTSSLSEKSPVTLLVKKWEITRHLEDYKRFLQDFAKGFSESDKFSMEVDKISSAMTLMIDLYDCIQKYGEQSQFADYLANINSPNALKLTINDPLSLHYISKMELALQASVLLTDYERAMQTFKQWVFPFASAYDGVLSTEIPNYLDPKMNLKTQKDVQMFLIPMLKDRVTKINDRLMEYRSMTFPRIDVSLMKSNFNSESTSSAPFYVWTAPSQSSRGIIADLFSGKTVSVGADPEYSYVRGKTAVKMTIAEFDFKIRQNPEKNAKLRDILNSFAIEMTHSGVSRYMWDDQSWEMVGDNVTLVYNLERDNDGERLSTNMVYDKMKNGNYILSPYTIWKVRLFRSNPNERARWSELTELAGLTDLELNGVGTFVDERAKARTRTIQEPHSLPLHMLNFMSTGTLIRTSSSSLDSCCI